MTSPVPRRADPRRLAAVRALEVLDTAAEPAFDEIAALAAAICRAEVAAVNIVDAERHFSKALVGGDGLGGSVPNDLSFCAATIEEDDGVLVVPDTRLDPAFASNPLVTGGPRVGHYAGASIICDGEPVGVVCVFGPGPREFSDVERDGLGVLARQAASQLTLRLENRALGQMAVTDPLTGLANRTLLLDRLDHALDSRRRGGGEVGVLFCDVDGFKAVNDSFGHEEGDRLLCAIASGLRASARSSDVVSRIAGDEFVVVCPAVGGPEELAVIAARLSSSGSALPEMPDGSPAPRLSVGAVLATDADSATTVVRRADQAMYASKDARRRLAVAVA